MQVNLRVRILVQAVQSITAVGDPRLGMGSFSPASQGGRQCVNGYHLPVRPKVAVNYFAFFEPAGILKQVTTFALLVKLLGDKALLGKRKAPVDTVRLVQF